jgi:hypothetical protein
VGPAAHCCAVLHVAGAVFAVAIPVPKSPATLIPAAIRDTLIRGLSPLPEVVRVAVLLPAPEPSLRAPNRRAETSANIFT